jgi:hypothetical protein
MRVVLPGPDEQYDHAFVDRLQGLVAEAEG